MSLKEMNARASVPSGFRYRARFSGSGGGATVFGAAFDDFLGDEKKARIPLFDGGAGMDVGVETMDFNMVTICGSRLIFNVSVNSNLLCSILP